MKKSIAIVLTLVFAIFLFAACGTGATESTADPTEPPPSATDTAITVSDPTPEPEETKEPEPEEETPKPEEAETPEPAEAKTPEPAVSEEPEKTGASAPSNAGVDAVDPYLHNTTETPVPLGQWTWTMEHNRTSDALEPVYIRVSRVSRDPDEVQSILDSYDGNWNLTLSPDQARDIEYGIVEYELYFAPDYTPASFGISVPSTSLEVDPVNGTSFRTDGGSTYIGLSITYDMHIRRDDDPPQPGDAIKGRHLFPMLKDYDESEYVFLLRWYDGEIKTENARQLYFAAS